jgi:hypothetical protein
LQVETGHGLFPKKFIEETLKEAPSGVWIVLESIRDGIPLIAIGYHYSTRNTLFLLLLKIGEPYKMKYTHDWGNIHICGVDQPDIISKFLKAAT